MAFQNFSDIFGLINDNLRVKIYINPDTMTLVVKQKVLNRIVCIAIMCAQTPPPNMTPSNKTRIKISV